MQARKIGAAAATAVALLAARDLVQKRHALLRNFPVLGHARYLLETIGPELRQYIVTSNEEERPFSRDQRTWIYASAKEENNYSGFGTEVDVEHVQGHAYVKQRTFAAARPDLHDPQAPLPSAKVLGGPRGRARAFRPASVVNISAMSFGSLSGSAVTALNRGAALAGTMHNTGEEASRRTTATAVTSSSSSARRTSAAATRTAPSTSTSSRTWSPVRRSRRSRSSSRRAPSRAWAGCCRARR
ncbi:hypothetical protein GCM10025734_12070 [Kitasatospora paranensis]